MLAVPTVFERMNVSVGDRITINVPVRSDDASDELVGMLVLNKNVFVNGVSQEQQIKTSVLEPGTFDDTGRAFDFDWQVNVSQGCYQLSLIVSHSANWSGDVPVRSDDTAIATWRVVVDDDGSIPAQACP